MTSDHSLYLSVREDEAAQDFWLFRVPLLGSPEVLSCGVASFTGIVCQG